MNRDFRRALAWSVFGSAVTLPLGAGIDSVSDASVVADPPLAGGVSSAGLAAEGLADLSFALGVAGSGAAAL